MRHEVVVALLVVCALSGAAVAQEAPAIENATTTFDVELQADGDADWTVRTEIPLDTAEERSGFETYAERFAAGNATAGPSIDFFRTAVELASTTADRNMTVTDVERSYSVDNTTGTLLLRFQWTAFLNTDGTGYELGDAFLSPDGTWLRSLEAGQEIRIYTPPGYDIQRSIEARQENDSLVITGPETFDPGEFSVVYQPADDSDTETDTATATATQTDTATPTDSPTSPGTDPEQGVDELAVALLGLLFLVIVVLAIWRWRGREPIATTTAESETASTAGGDGSAAATAAESDGGDDDGEVAPELLADEERVETLLQQNGGRMRQADIVAETDWSDAKVSQLLSRMADEGSIEKLRLGRENVISLPEDSTEE